VTDGALVAKRLGVVDDVVMHRLGDLLAFMAAIQARMR
jgi:hypothetical protein